MPVYYHDKRSKGANEYLEVARELASNQIFVSEVVSSSLSSAVSSSVSGVEAVTAFSEY